jgi:hypothetical protein
MNISLPFSGRKKSRKKALEEGSELSSVSIRFLFSLLFNLEA